VNTDKIVNAAQQFVNAWAGYAASDNACHMTQTEMESLADLFIVCGEPGDATGLMEAWIEAEIEDGEVERGDITVVDTINGPTLVDNRTEGPVYESEWGNATAYEIAMGLDN
jgi:hypothetical protein